MFGRDPSIEGMRYKSNDVCISRRKSRQRPGLWFWYKPFAFVFGSSPNPNLRPPNATRSNFEHITSFSPRQLFLYNTTSRTSIVHFGHARILHQSADDTSPSELSHGTWTSEEAEKLEELRSKGASAGDIARALSRLRHSHMDLILTSNSSKYYILCITTLYL